jgi:mutator protein MutT
MNQVSPLQIFAYCPRCGATGGEARTIKQYVCAVCGFQYFQNAATAVIAVLRDPEGRILFTRREKDPARGMLDLPGGFVDPLETAEAALAREVREEIGIEIVSPTFLASFTNRYDYKGVTYYTCDLVFLCAAADLSALSALDEVTDTLFLAPAEVNLEEVGFESVRNIVGRLRETPSD